MDRVSQLENLRAQRVAELEWSSGLRAEHVVPGRALDLARLDAVQAGLSARVLGSVLSGRANKTEVVAMGSGDADAEAVAADLVELADLASLAREVRGQDDLAVGFPFLVGEIAGTALCAPLFLFPRALVLDDSGRRKPRWCLPAADDDARDVRPNLTLARVLGLDPSTMADWGRANLVGLRRTPTWLSDASRAVAEWLAGQGVFAHTVAPGGRPGSGDDERVVALPAPSAAAGAPTVAAHALLARMPTAEEAVLAELEALVQRMRTDKGCALGAADWLLSGAGTHDELPEPRGPSWWELRVPDRGGMRAWAALEAGRSAVVEAAPGTDAVGLAADLLAACTGEGKRVVVLAPSRSTLDDVADRLGPVARGLLVTVADAAGAAAALDVATAAARTLAQDTPSNRDGTIATVRAGQERLDAVQADLDAPLASGGTARQAIERLLSTPPPTFELPVDELPTLPAEIVESHLVELAQVVRDRVLNNAPGTWAENRPSYADRSEGDLQQFIERGLPEVVRAVDLLMDWMSHDPGHGRSLGEAADRVADWRSMIGMCEPMAAISQDGWRWVSRLLTLSSRRGTEGGNVDAVEKDRQQLETLLALREAGQGKEIVANPAEQKAAEAAFVEWLRLAELWYRPFMAGWYAAQSEVEDALEREQIAAPTLVDGIAEWRRRRDYTVMVEGLPTQFNALALTSEDLRTTSARELDIELSAALEAAGHLDAWHRLPADRRALLPRGIPTNSRLLTETIAILQHAEKARELADRFEANGSRLEAWIGPAVGAWVEDAFAAGESRELDTRFRSQVGARFRAMAASDRRRAELATRSKELAEVAPLIAPHVGDAGVPEIADAVDAAFARRRFRDAMVERPSLGGVDDRAVEGHRDAVAAGWRTLIEQNRLAVAAALGRGLLQRSDAVANDLPDVVVDAIGGDDRRSLEPPPPVCLCTPPGAAALPPVDVGFDVAVVVDAGRMLLADALPCLARARTAVVIGDSESLMPLGMLGTGALPPGVPLSSSPAPVRSVMEAGIATGDVIRLEWSREPGCPELRTLAGFLRPDGGPAVAPTTCPSSAPVSWLTVGGRRLATGNDHEAVLSVEVAARLLGSRAADDVAIVTLDAVQATRVGAEIARRRTVDGEFATLLGEAATGRLRVRPVEAFAGDRAEVVVLTIAGVPDASGRLGAGLGTLGHRMARRLATVLAAPRRHLVILCSFDPDAVTTAEDPGLGAFLEVLRELRRLSDGGSFQQTAPEPEPALLTDRIAAALEARGIACEREVGIAGVVVDLAVRSAVVPECTPLAVVVDGALSGDDVAMRSMLLAGAGWAVESVDALTWLRGPTRVVSRLSEARELADAGLATGSRALGITLPAGAATRPVPARKGRVEFGSIVKLRRLDDRTEEQVRLAKGATKGELALDTPLAHTVLGALPGDRLVLFCGTCATAIEVVEVDGVR